MEPVGEPVGPADGEGDEDGDRDRPRYEKPVIRRYDQIDQVHPYGPSEV